MCRRLHIQFSKNSSNEFPLISFFSNKYTKCFPDSCNHLHIPSEYMKKLQVTCQFTMEDGCHAATDAIARLIGRRWSKATNSYAVQSKPQG